MYCIQKKFLHILCVTLHYNYKYTRIIRDMKLKRKTVSQYVPILYRHKSKFIIIWNKYDNKRYIVHRCCTVVSIYTSHVFILLLLLHLRMFRYVGEIEYNIIYNIYVYLGYNIWVHRVTIWTYVFSRPRSISSTWIPISKVVPRCTSIINTTNK